MVNEEIKPAVLKVDNPVSIVQLINWLRYGDLRDGIVNVQMMAQAADELEKGLNHAK